MSLDKISHTLEKGSKNEKIVILESLVKSSESQIINLIISKLDDPDIEVRGEAFASLVLNENNISQILIDNLSSQIKNIRAFSALVLANRQNYEAISSIIPLTKDQSAMVRSCALGALGYLRAQQATQAIHDCFSDSNIEVKKSALKAAIDIGKKVPQEKIETVLKEDDPELEKLLVQIRKL